MEPTQDSQQRPTVRHHADTSSPSASPTTDSAPHDGLKKAATSLKDSGLGYLQAKTELAAIETQEASAYAKEKFNIAVITALFAIFSYALIHLFLYGILLQYADAPLTSISNAISLSPSNIVIFLFMVINLTFFKRYFKRFQQKPQEELFALTKSEFQKDKKWLAEINQTQEN